MEKETADHMIKMKARNFISLIVSIIVVTNSFSIIYGKVLRSEAHDLEIEEKREYDRARNDRKLKNTVEYERLLDNYEDCQKELKECKESK